MKQKRITFASVCWTVLRPNSNFIIYVYRMFHLRWCLCLTRRFTWFHRFHFLSFILTFLRYISIIVNSTENEAKKKMTNRYYSIAMYIFIIWYMNLNEAHCKTCLSYKNWQQNVNEWTNVNCVKNVKEESYLPFSFFIFLFIFFFDFSSILLHLHFRSENFLLFVFFYSYLPTIVEFAYCQRVSHHWSYGQINAFVSRTYSNELIEWIFVRWLTRAWVWKWSKVRAKKIVQNVHDEIDRIINGRGLRVINKYT